MMEEENNSTMIGIDNDIEVEFAIVNKRDSFEFVEICDNFIYNNVNHIYTFGRDNYIYIIDSTGRYLRVLKNSDQIGRYKVYYGSSMEGSFAKILLFNGMMLRKAG